MPQKLWVLGLALGGLLVGCVPAPLRPQAATRLQLQVTPQTPPLQTLTGETLYRAPGPGALRVRTSAGASVAALFVAGTGPVTVINVGPVPTGGEVAVPLPPTGGYAQVYTVASEAPLDLSAAQGARTLGEAAAVVEAAARPLGPGAYTVATTVYRVARFGTLRVDSVPGGAQVRVGGRLAGTTPLILPDLPEGQVTLDLSRPGYVPVSRRVTVVPDAVTDVVARLPLPTGTLSVESDVPADVYVAGQGIGRVAPATPLRLSARPGVLSINVVPLDTSRPAQNLLARVSVGATTAISCAGAGAAYTCQIR